ncbi:MAG: T9SS type A sorting domain-containing protein [Bacteroidia bacterium]|nr:T9SS type A sorting domain-containing protein [Bacteroidia bacterium]
MKKIYFLAIGALLATMQTKAQDLEMFDPIKETRFMVNTPEMNILFKSGVGVQEEKINGVWKKEGRFIGVQDEKGNQIEFGEDEWDSTTNSYLLGERITNKFVYDGTGRVISNYMLIMSEGEKQMSRTFTYTYDGSGKYLPVKSIDSIFGDVPMNYESTDSIVYNASGKIEQRIESMSLLGMNILKSRKTYTYDASGNITDVLVEEHDGANWEDNIRFTLTYNGSNQVLIQKSEFFDGTEWKFDDLDSFSYNAAGKIISSVEFNSGMNQIEPSGNSLYTYSGDNLSEVIERSWNGTAYENENKVVLNYDGSALASVYFFDWLGSDYETEHSMRITFTSGSVGLASAKNLPSVQMYPNPAVESISFDGIIASALVQVIDVQGKVLLNETVNTAQNNISVAHLTSGIYFVKIQSGSQIVVKRLVKD